jgi:hypothetical protein
MFSTNRLEYLIPNLKSQSFFNFHDCQVHKILIDDYPKTRNNNLLIGLLNAYNFNEIILHENNLGLSTTFTQFFQIIKDRDFDYILHLEDDIKLLEPVLITDLIEILENDPSISQVQLARQAWYSYETDPVALPDDLIYKNYRFRKGSQIFSPMASLYPLSIAKIPFRDYIDLNLNEGMIGTILYNFFGKTSANVKNFHGKNIIEHIGEWSIGKRVIEGDPGFENWGHIPPDSKHSSRYGSPY